MEYEAGVKEALAEVQNKGLEDGNEHLVILRDGQVHWRADGTKTRVDYKAAEVKEGDIIVHNHPNSLNSLSNVDTLQVFTRGLKAVYAITADNSVYKASAVEATAPDRFMMDWDIASNEFASPQTMLSVANVPRETKARINEAHWVNRMLAAKGKFKYEFELGPETQRIVDEFDQRMHFDEVRDDYVNADFTPFIDLMNMLRGVGLVASILGAENAPTIKDYLGYENARNKRNAATYERLIKRAIGPGVKVAVLVGHHITFELNGDLATENEVPSADCLMFDHDFMGKVFGPHAVQIMQELVAVDCDKRDKMLKDFLDEIEQAEDATV